MPQPSDAPLLADAVTVVIPCYDAGDRLAPVVTGALRETPHVIVVDDGSTDGAPNGVTGLGARLVGFPENRGKGAALLAGFRAAFEREGCACVVIVDADGQHDTTEIAKLYQAFCREHADLVIGERDFGQVRVPWASWIGNRMTSAVSARLLGVRLPDTQSGFRLHSRRFAEDILASVAAGRYETEMAILIRALRGGFRVRGVPIRTIYDPGNRTSHFRKIRDSWRVWRVLFVSAFRGSRHV